MLAPSPAAQADTGTITGSYPVVLGSSVALPSDVFDRAVTYTTQSTTFKSNGQVAKTFATSPPQPLGIAGFTKGRDISPASVKLDAAGALKITDGAANGRVLTSDANGAATWGEVSAAGLAANSVTTTQIATGAVGSSEIANGTIGLSDLAAGVIPHTGGVNNSFSSPSFIGGGTDNTITGSQGANSVIAGGRNNSAGSGFGQYAGATVGGGLDNTASNLATTVAGGLRNTASSYYGAILGGNGNIANGIASTVAGGVGNTAAGDYSFSAGRKAIAGHSGAFVWGDSSDGEKYSIEADSFTVYARGGSRFFTNLEGTSSVGLLPGSGTWSSLSDRDSKENLALVDARDVLAKVVAMPTATWNYKTQAAQVRHMGPMAQDFRAAFGLGASEKLIDTVDPDGVALAAIQGLAAVLEEKDAEITSLREQMGALELQLQAVLERLER